MGASKCSQAVWEGAKKAGAGVAGWGSNVFTMASNGVQSSFERRRFCRASAQNAAKCKREDDIIAANKAKSWAQFRSQNKGYGAAYNAGASVVNAGRTALTTTVTTLNPANWFGQRTRQ